MPFIEVNKLSERLLLQQIKLMQQKLRKIKLYN